MRGEQASPEITTYYQRRDRELGQGTKGSYMAKANAIHQIFTDEELPSQPKKE